MDQKYRDLNQKFMENRAIFEQIDTFPPEKQKPYREFLEEMANVKSQLEELEVKADKLNTLYKKKCEATIAIKNSTHPNVVIFIGHRSIDIKSDSNKAILTENHALNVIKRVPIDES